MSDSKYYTFAHVAICEIDSCDDDIIIVVCPKCEKIILGCEGRSYESGNGYLCFMSSVGEQKIIVDCHDCGQYMLCHKHKLCWEEIGDIDPILNNSYVNTKAKLDEEISLFEEHMIEIHDIDFSFDSDVCLKWYDVGVCETTHLEMIKTIDNKKQIINEELKPPIIFLYSGQIDCDEILSCKYECLKCGTSHWTLH